MFGKFARSQMRSIYKKLYRKYYVASLSEREDSVLKWRLRILRDPNRRITRAIARFPDFAIYSGAATTGNRISPLLFMGGKSGRPFALRAADSAASGNWTDAFHRTILIYGLELLALLAFIFMLRFYLKGFSINCYLGNNNALCALIKGDSNTAIIADVVATFWRLLQKFGIDIWLGRVSSKMNIADHPASSMEGPPYSAQTLSEYNERFRMLMVVKRARSNCFKKDDFVERYESRNIKKNSEPLVKEFAQ